MRILPVSTRMARVSCSVPSRLASVCSTRIWMPRRRSSRLSSREVPKSPNRRRPNPRSRPVSRRVLDLSRSTRPDAPRVPSGSRLRSRDLAHPAQGPLRRTPVRPRRGPRRDFRLAPLRPLPPRGLLPPRTSAWLAPLIPERRRRCSRNVRVCLRQALTRIPGSITMPGRLPRRIL